MSNARLIKELARVLNEAEQGGSGNEGLDSCCAVATSGSAKTAGGSRDLPWANADAMLY